KLAETYRAFGDVGAALDAAQTEMQLTERLPEGDLDGQRDSADSHIQIGAALEAQGEVANAQKEYETALAIIAPLAAKHPSNLDLLDDLTKLQLDFGAILLDHDLGGALREYEAALTSIAQLPDHEAAKPFWQNRLAAIRGITAFALQLSGDLAGAVKESQAA